MLRTNISGFEDIDDPFYRYKMDKLKITRQKNKTIIDNIDKVCKDLHRDPQLLIEFYKKKFGIAMIYKNNILSTTARFDDIDDKLNKGLREFIEYYVLCSKCRLPETKIEKLKDIVTLSCDCCSFVTKSRFE